MEVGKMKKYKLLIDNQWIESSNKENMDVLNPSDERIIGSVPMASKEDALKAIEVSSRAQKEWAKLSAKKRADYLVDLADAILEHKEKFAKLLTREQGKLLVDAYGEVDVTAEFIRYAAESARRMEGEILNSDRDNEQIMIQRVPYGVTVGLLTWNYPLALAGRKLGNALVTGNTMVLMPPLHAPMAVYELGELIADILPPGVINIVTGAGHIVGDSLVRHPATRLVSLTGSTPIGRLIAKAASENLSVLSLELGGKSPFIVMEDTDVKKAAEIAVASGYGNCGQICTSNERMYIHEAIYDEFMTYFVEGVKALKVGNPMDETTDVGPKMNRNEVDKIEALVEKAKEQGAKVLVGGSPLREGDFAIGFWFAPTVLEVDSNQNEIMKEETFGPVVAAMKVKSFDEALDYANDSDYGLSGYLFTDDMKKIMRAMRDLEVGELYVNRPNGELINGFHSGMKLSGIGGEDGKHGLELYSQKKTVYVNFSV
jgi:lactaldehyde dehydrogenase/glycolaldehyde dehydrogenase